MVSGRRSTTGNPLFVAGPQIGYFYPGLTLEADISWPGHDMRGIYSPAHPGVIFIGRGEDFAYSLTSAGNDTADEFVETLCGGSDTRYRYKGRCLTMGRVNAGRLRDEDVVFRTTVHGPVTGYATVDGRRVAIARRRSSAGPRRPVDAAVPGRDARPGPLGRGTCSAWPTASRTRSTSAYADSRDIALFSAGRLPIRDRRVDPRLPTKGTASTSGAGFLPGSKHPQQKNPSTGALLNWNNRPAPQFGSADNDWEHGSLHRNRLPRGGHRQARQARPRRRSSGR
jgi:acyl-homoserine lactone acylase PvdQ